MTGWLRVTCLIQARQTSSEPLYPIAMIIRGVRDWEMVHSVRYAVLGNISQYLTRCPEYDYI